jgi:hypothetical protein
MLSLPASLHPRSFSSADMHSTATPNHSLQRSAPHVTAPASTTAFPPTVQVPRRAPRSLSLGSLGVSRAHRVTNHCKQP